MLCVRVGASVERIYRQAAAVGTARSQYAVRCTASHCTAFVAGFIDISRKLNKKDT